MRTRARPLLPSEAAVWKALRCEAVSLFPDAFLASVAEAEDLPLATIRNRLEAGNTLGVFQDGTCVGIATLLPDGRDRTRHRASLAAFYIAPKAQGTGASDALMRAAIARAEAMGIWQIELYVAEANMRAIRFYTRHGFKRFGLLPNATWADGLGVTDLFLVRISQSDEGKR